MVHKYPSIHVILMAKFTSLCFFKANNLTTDNFVVDKMMPELLELVNTYLPDILWSDGEAGAWSTITS
jgi:hypothetical protein